MAAKQKYRWKAAPHVSLSAQTVGEELERIRSEHGGKLVAADVVAASERRSSPLHRAFTWDDHKAARKWRLEQASELIRSIEVVVTISRGRERNLRAFVSVTRDDERSYASLAEAMTDVEMREQVLRRAWDELQSWKRRYENLSEFAKVHAIIDRLKPPTKKAA